MNADQSAKDWEIIKDHRGMTDLEFLESMAQSDKLIDHQDNCGQCYHQFIMAQVARDMLAANDIEDVVSKWAKEAGRRWRESKYVKLWDEARATGLDPNKVFEEKGWGTLMHETAAPVSLPLVPIMTIESLVDFGFKEFKIMPHDKHDRNWQYCLRDDKGKRIYVQVRFWEFSKFSKPDHLVNDSFDAWCQFDAHHGNKTFNVDLSVNDMTPQQVVEWFDNMFKRMGCSHYELFDEYREDDVRNTCQKCHKYLTPDEAVEPFLCPACKEDSGFKPHIPRIKRKRR